VVIPLRFYLLLLAAIAAERIFELYLTRRNAHRAFARGAIEVGQRHYRVMAALHTAFIASCAIEAMGFPRAMPAAFVWGALGAEAAAQALRYWAVATLGERWNTRVIVTPDAAPVTGGPYRFLRHPNYLAVVIEIAAVPLIGGAIVTAIVFSILNAVLLAVRIHTEERALGARWAEAFGARPRLIPTLGHGPRAS
jgi:methyltransferase